MPTIYENIVKSPLLPGVPLEKIEFGGIGGATTKGDVMADTGTIFTKLVLVNKNNSIDGIVGLYQGESTKNYQRISQRYRGVNIDFNNVGLYSLDEIDLLVNPEFEVYLFKNPKIGFENYPMGFRHQGKNYGFTSDFKVSYRMTGFTKYNVAYNNQMTQLLFEYQNYGAPTVQPLSMSDPTLPVPTASYVYNALAYGQYPRLSNC
jgi:hypothetical protein